MPIQEFPALEPVLAALAERVPTPFYAYDETLIGANARSLIEAFSWCPGFRQHFAVKATPTPGIVKVLKDAGCGVDCASLPELELAARLGFSGAEPDRKQSQIIQP